jgi:hypothetical protein
MTASRVVPPEVEQYLSAVRAALGDLPSAERDDLVAEVEASLVEAAEESPGPIVARLGPPEEFAAELRAAAGLREPTPPAPREPQLVQRLRKLVAAFAASPRAVAVRRLASELAPIWWVARGYLAVGLIAVVFDTGWSARYPIVPRFGTPELGLAAIAAAALVSVWVGLQMRRHGRPFPRLAAVLNLALLLAAIPVAAEVTSFSSPYAFVSPVYAPPRAVEGLAYNGVSIDNIYPYSREGRLLHDVLLYDGAGRPLEIPGNRGLDPDRRVVVTNGNRPLFNAFPIRYYEPGTRRVARPNATPYVELPLVLTPPLPAKASG